MNRRGFLGTILALGAAPAIVKASSLMQIVVRAPLVIAPADTDFRSLIASMQHAQDEINRISGIAARTMLGPIEFRTESRMYGHEIAVSASVLYEEAGVVEQMRFGLHGHRSNDVAVMKRTLEARTTAFIERKPWPEIVPGSTFDFYRRNA